MPSSDLLADVALLGGGGAGLSLLLALEREATAQRRPVPAIVLIDPVHRSGADRTWCWWEPAGSGGLTPLLHRSWGTVELFDRGARPITVGLGDLRYVMLRSQDLYDEAGRAAARMNVHRIQAPAGDLLESGGRVLIEAGGQRVRARWVFDSRPAPPQRAPITSLLQHFRGWTVRATRPRRAPRLVFDPDTPTLMDFRVPQPSHAVAFGYCLPLQSDRALIEYTEFGSRRLRSAEYDVALRAYLRQRWDAEPGDYEIEAVEDGVIPMTDAGYQVRAGQRIFRIGTAGGATRGSTGYTLAAAQRQAREIARRLFAGAEPVPPPAYPARHRWMDAVLLRALDRRLVAGPELFTTLFTTVPPASLIAFLDGLSRPGEELAVMRAAPPVAMVRAGAEDALLRLISRVVPRAGEAARDATRETTLLIRSVASRYLK